MKKKPTIRKNRYPLPRKHKVTIMFNDEEYKTICHYMAKYKITNRSHWVRDTVIHAVFQRLTDDYPTLFSEHEMRG
ncbi:MAG: hypothetical protein LUG18_10075 [Candidatus Azobacteroides sp.]|nr:hypothetical protein [Candidatus Azobacteroides sp.]